MRRFSLLLVLAVIVAMLLPFSAAAAPPLSGAVFTTDSSCTGVNLNVYNAQADVYLDGGPAHPGAAGLPDGSYYVQVTEPQGAVLGQSLTAVASVSGGEFASCYQLAAILFTASSGFTAAGYDATSNSGGEYKVWVSSVSTFDNSSTKTDNFKVKPSGAPPAPGEIEVVKFYDANANGLNDDGQEITGWKVRIQDDIDYTRFTPVDILVDPNDTYTGTEFAPTESNWMATTSNPMQFFLNEGENHSVEFGNMCVGAGGGLTLGFWSNKNGHALFGSDDLALMVSLNLRNANGSNFDPANYAQFRTWLLGATATNMANMLSAQLAAMDLNVNNSKVNGASLIYAPGSSSANSLGFATVSALLAEANTSLGANGSTVASGAIRKYQEALKNALDRTNNNLTFVQATPCAFTFAP